MNIQDRIAKLEKELVELKEQCVDVPWTPREGEICEVSENGREWLVRKVYKYKPEEENPYVSDFAKWPLARPLNDPMVIQFIPHKPGDPMPCGGDEEVIIRFRSGCIGVQHAGETDWSLAIARSLFSSDVIAWAPLNED